MKRLFATIATTFVLASLFIAPQSAPASPCMEWYEPMSVPYFSSNLVLGYEGSYATPLSARLQVTPLEGLNSLALDFYPLSQHSNGYYIGTTSVNYYGWPLDFHFVLFRWGNLAFVRILTSCNGVFFDDRNEIFTLIDKDCIQS